MATQRSDPCGVQSIAVPQCPSAARGTGGAGFLFWAPAYGDVRITARAITTEARNLFLTFDLLSASNQGATAGGLLPPSPFPAGGPDSSFLPFFANVTNLE